jgi:hypothetical protein
VPAPVSALARAWHQLAQAQSGAQVSPEAHSHAEPQLQSAPHGQFSSREAHAQLWLQVHDVVLISLVIGTSWGFRL